jgi:hypothetical protein
MYIYEGHVYIAWITQDHNFESGHEVHFEFLEVITPRNGNVVEF